MRLLLPTLRDLSCTLRSNSIYKVFVPLDRCLCICSPINNAVLIRCINTKSGYCVIIMLSFRFVCFLSVIINLHQAIMVLGLQLLGTITANFNEYVS